MALARKDLVCVPVHLEPPQRLGLTRCEVIPGVTLVKLSDGLRAKLDQVERPTTSFRANFSILVNVTKYANGVRQRIRKRGEQVPQALLPIGLVILTAG